VSRFIELPLEGCFLIDFDPNKDDRGIFFEWYKSSWEFKAQPFVPGQANVSVSYQNTIRGLHYGTYPDPQKKLITVLDGEIYDVLLDVRKESKTFGKSINVKMSSSVPQGIFIPDGIAHGFSVPIGSATLCYLVSNEYDPFHEQSINPLDTSLGINWQIGGSPLLTNRDRDAPSFKSVFE
jgi:dTDP-4-dehydrorhamnose 3,5-epimerase